jgi:hypothetical protein
MSPIIGRLRRSRARTETRAEAIARARSMPWWVDGLELDSGNQRWWVFRTSTGWEQPLPRRFAR